MTNENPGVSAAGWPVAAPQILAAILETAVSAIVTIDADGLILQANPATTRMFGYQMEDLLGRNISLLMPEPHRSRHDGYIRRHLATGARRIIGIGREIEGERKDGSVFPMHLSVSAFETGGAHYFTGTVVDLSERNRRAALAETVFDHVPDGLVITDNDDRIVHCNAAFKRMFGAEAVDLNGCSSAGLYATTGDFERMQALRERRSGAAAGDTHQFVDAAFRRVTGEIFPTRTVTATIREPGGARIGYLCIIRDVTREIAQQEALRKAQRMEAYGHLTGGVAHDFNNLLTIIMGNQELLEMRLKDERDLALIKRAQDAAEMGARLTGRLLTFARRRQLEPTVVHLNDQLSGLAELLRRTLGEPINLACRFASDLWTVRADQSEIENAVLNLAINARDAMPKGGSLVVETSNVTFAVEDAEATGGIRPGDYVRLSVSDTGTGMSGEVLARAFEPFFSTKEPGRGTGLGLSTVYGFVKQSGGHVTIYSELGHGTTVNLYLPSAEAKVAARPSVRPGEMPAPRHETILVVEDNPEVREVSMARLAHLGFAVIEADSGPAAVRVLETGCHVDLVFSDIVMAGGMSGFDLADWVVVHRPGVKVLLTSGFTPEVARAEDAGEQKLKILRKPYSRQDLSEALREALGS